MQQCLNQVFPQSTRCKYTVRKGIISRQKLIDNLISKYPPPPHLTGEIPKDYIAGFITGDGSFEISFKKQNLMKTGLHLQSHFEISQNQRSLYLLKQISQQIGDSQRIYLGDKNVWYLVHSKYKDLTLIVKYFNQVQFQCQKQQDFLIFRAVLQCKKNKSHLLQQYLTQIIKNLRKQVENRKTTRGATQLLKIVQDNYKDQKNEDLKQIIPWSQGVLTERFFTGFTDAEGSFIVYLKPGNQQWPLIYTQIQFSLGAHQNSQQLLTDINTTFLRSNGNIYKKENGNYYMLIVDSIKTNLEIVIPFFLQNPLLSSKYYDFIKFVEVAYMIKFKKHKTMEGIRKIIDIAHEMNSSKEGEQGSIRRQTKQQYLTYLELAQSREEFLQIKDKLASCRKRILVSKYQKKVMNQNAR
eukprot:TRINITY_DN4509_c0_g1_i1.p1 TRINITY_DN4509_c0_g1~~TRINITY_DN4509_c0_g1_i1.p1  ORF type:complete len:410 (-),score=3.30 TRINITY_DN4509_c0_g1_i1:118-1347(-)